jgi:transposase
MNIATVGLDLAKSVLQVHAVDSQGQVVVRKQLRRADVLRYFATLQPCVIGMEAGSVAVTRSVMMYGTR